MIELNMAPPVPALKFTVYGTPQPQGSTRAFVPKGWSRPVLTSDNSKLKPWRQQVTQTAIPISWELCWRAPRSTAVAVHVDFYFNKPVSAKKRNRPTVKPDVDKLVRGILDALTGVLYEDDSQIVEVVARKFYDPIERAEIMVQEV